MSKTLKRGIGLAITNRYVGITLMLLVFLGASSLVSAAVTHSSFEGEAGTMAGGASGINDATASGGQALLFSTPTQVTGSYPKQISADKRFVLDQLGNPWFMVGDAGWSAIGQLNLSETEYYFDQLQAHGFNTAMVSLIENRYSDSPPRNRAGQLPYSSGMFKSTPTESYWAFVDTFVAEAAERGITILACPAYIGYNADGLAAELSSATNAQMTAYGEFLGNRYKSNPNILWMMGGDRTNVDATLLARTNAMATGIKSTDPNHLMTAHVAQNASSDSVFGSYSWLDINNSYEVDIQPISYATSAWNDTPTRPTFSVEGLYEQERDNPLMTFGHRTLRYQAWGAIVAGSFGHVFGNNPRWHFQGQTLFPFTGTWQESLNHTTGNRDQGTIHQGYIASFIASVGSAWGQTMPDLTDTFLTAGELTGTNQAGARFSNRMGMIYMPAQRSVTLDLTEINAFSNARIRKYDPSNGSFTVIGTYPTTGSQTVQTTSLGTNSNGDTDWVLLVEGI